MLTEIQLYPIFTDLDPNLKTVSVAIDTIIYRDGVEISRERNRRAFVPGQLDDVKAFIGVNESHEITYLEAIWTQEVIDEYNAQQELLGNI